VQKFPKAFNKAPLLDLRQPGATSAAQPETIHICADTNRPHNPEDHTMKPLYTILALSTAALLTACAGAGAATTADEHAAHGGGMQGHMQGHMQGRMQGRMQHTPEMQAMHEQMKNAKTPEERQALMNEHMKTMHPGMDPAACMEGMHGMQRKGG
jgi:Spy/CpxP family protein refolding chaperone